MLVFRLFFEYCSIVNVFCVVGLRVFGDFMIYDFGFRFW